jgi:hypothetical protein
MRASMIPKLNLSRLTADEESKDSHRSGGTSWRKPPLSPYREYRGTAASPDGQLTARRISESWRATATPRKEGPFAGSSGFTTPLASPQFSDNEKSHTPAYLPGESPRLPKPMFHIRKQLPQERLSGKGGGGAGGGGGSCGRGGGGAGGAGGRDGGGGKGRGRVEGGVEEENKGVLSGGDDDLAAPDDSGAWFHFVRLV